MLVKDLILSNPDLPLVVVMHKDDSVDFYGFENIHEEPEGYIGEILRHEDFQNDFGLKTFFELGELEDAIYENSAHELSDEEIKAEAKKYAPYWKKSIIMEL